MSKVGVPLLAAGLTPCRGTGAGLGIAVVHTFVAAGG